MPTMIDDDVRPLAGWAKPPLSLAERHEREQEIAALRLIAASPRVSQFCRNYCAADADALTTALARELERTSS